ncbi:MAG: hypothetical protein Q8N04_04600 [Nitrospira sp.]|nr:hypothetical protein [Nitrospira sp.]
MNKLDWPTPFGDVRSLVCEAIQSGEGEDLLLRLVEHVAANHEETIQIGEVKISGSPIGRNEESRQWLVYWKRVAGFKSSSESFYFSIYQIEGKTDARAFKVQDSVWIKDMQNEGVMGSVLPQCQHFVIATDHKIIEVLAVGEPEIKACQ